MKRVIYSRDAIKTLGGIPKDLANRIRQKVEQHMTDPSAVARNVAKLQGRPGYRLRVGSWRVIFEEGEAVLRVLEIGPRGGIYK